MTFDELYAEHIRRWPKSVDVSDGYPTANGGHLFPTLTRLNDEIDASLSTDDPWGLIFCWALFQSFHSEARRLLRTGVPTLHPEQVDKLEIDRWVRSNLEPVLGEDEWRAEREAYQGFSK